MVLPWLKSKDFFIGKLNNVNQNTMEGWVKIYRSILTWEWYSDINVRVLFIHLLLKANHAPKSWRGIEIQAGQLVTSLSRLEQETGLSQKKIRNALKKLEKTGELVTQKGRAYTLITICNYASYQGGMAEEGTPKGTPKGTQRAHEGHTKGTQRATNNNDNNDNNDKNNNNPNISLSKENNSLSKDIFVPSRDSESDKFDTLNSIKPKLERTKGKALFDVPVQKKKKVSQDKYLALATKLSEIIQTKKNIKHTKSQIQAWSKEFARLERENGIQYQRQKAAMRWYEEHIGDPYTPVIESGTSFRNKFIKLEAAIVRSENSYTQKTKNNSGYAHFNPEYNDILMRKATEKITVL